MTTATICPDCGRLVSPALAADHVCLPPDDVLTDGQVEAYRRAYAAAREVLDGIDWRTRALAAEARATKAEGERDTAIRTLDETQQALAVCCEAEEAARQLKQDLDEETALRERLSEILTGVANALKGAPSPLSSHGFSDLPEFAAKVGAAWDAALHGAETARRERDTAREERDRAREALRLCVTVLDEDEWAGQPCSEWPVAICVECDATRSDGHKPDCALASALSAARRCLGEADHA